VRIVFWPLRDQAMTGSARQRTPTDRCCGIHILGCCQTNAHKSQFCSNLNLLGWGDDVIDAKTRSMMNLSMIGALGKMAEWETHCRGAINNGVSKEEIRAIIHVIGIYCGVPQALECFRVAGKVFEDIA
jgi:alkylhydroperoxidase/carboxymuconolactone decarboxylase family protein YurZ